MCQTPALSAGTVRSNALSALLLILVGTAKWLNCKNTFAEAASEESVQLYSDILRLLRQGQATLHGKRW